jgi:hypothetical protein
VGADTNRRLLDPDEALRRLETRPGPLHARLRLGIEREHEAQAFGQGLSLLHLENLPLMQAMIEIALRVTGTYWRGRANARKVQVRRNNVRLKICPALSWLHRPASERPAWGSSQMRKQRSFRDRLANRPNRPFAALKARPCERTEISRKRSLAEGVGCTEWRRRRLVPCGPCPCQQ